MKKTKTRARPKRRTGNPRLARKLRIANSLVLENLLDMGPDPVSRLRTNGSRMYMMLECSNSSWFDDRRPYRSYIGIVNRGRALKYRYWRFKVVHSV